MATKIGCPDAAVGLEYRSGAEKVDFDHPDGNMVGGGLLVTHWRRILPCVPLVCLKFGSFALVGHGGERAVDAEYC